MNNKKGKYQIKINGKNIYAQSFHGKLARENEQLKEENRRLKEDNRRLLGKLGWRKVHSKEQLVNLPVGTYGFLDSEGTNYYGVKSVSGLFHLNGNSEVGGTDGIVRDGYDLHDLVVSYRKMHNWNRPVKTEKEILDDILAVASENLSTASVAYDGRGHFDITLTGRVCDMAKALGISLEKEQEKG